MTQRYKHSVRHLIYQKLGDIGDFVFAFMGMSNFGIEEMELPEEFHSQTTRKSKRNVFKSLKIDKSSLKIHLDESNL